jgi:hypothetical protein
MRKPAANQDVQAIWKLLHLYHPNTYTAKVVAQQ